MTEMGRIILLVGLGMAVFGAILLAAGRLFPWLGNLPGDIRIDGENSKVFIPITSMILISIVGTVILNLILRYFRRCPYTGEPPAAFQQTLPGHVSIY